MTRDTRAPDTRRIKVAHLTSVHPQRDPRIYLKECRALADAGFDVVLIAPEDPSARQAGSDGTSAVRIRTVPRRGGRISRMLRTTFDVFRAARAEKPAICHFHDPELIPWAFVLRLLGTPVVYDVHEDYHSGMLQKEYLPRWVRSAVALAIDRVETLAARCFHVVIAEEYYRDRFPGATEVLNYPVVSDEILESPGCDPLSGRLLYTGSITVDRGARIHTSILAHDANATVTLLGRCSVPLAAELRKIAGSAADRLTIIGEGTYVDPAHIQAAYRDGGWMAGLAVFPDTLHYRRKILTKMFEYMMAGLPIVCSDFPVWRRLIDEIGCGLCVPPNDPRALAEAITRLSENPDEARAMGRRGREAVLSRYRWETQAQNLVDLYRSALRAG